MALVACGKTGDEETLDDAAVQLFINECRAGSGVSVKESALMNTEYSTISITAVGEGKADIALSFNYMKNCGLTQNASCEILLKGVPYRQANGAVAFNTTLPEGTMALGIVEEPFAFTDIRISGSVRDGSGAPVADLKIEGTAKSRPFALVISGVTRDRDKAGFNPDTPIVEVEPIEWIEFAFTNTSSWDCTVRDDKGVLSLAIPSGKTERQMAGSLVLSDGNQLHVAYADGRTDDYAMDYVTGEIKGLSYEKSYDFFLSTGTHKIEPYYYEIQAYRLP